MFSIKNTINVAFTILFNGFLAFRMCIKRPKRKMVCFFNVVCTEITEDILLAQESFALWSIFYLFQKSAKNISLLQYNTSQVPITYHRSVNQLVQYWQKRGILRERECPSQLYHNIIITFNTSSRHTLSHDSNFS